MGAGAQAALLRLRRYGMMLAAFNSAAAIAAKTRA
jgi:hypothetical protein